MVSGSGFEGPDLQQRAQQGYAAQTLNEMDAGLNNMEFETKSANTDHIVISEGRRICELHMQPSFLEPGPRYKAQA